MWFNIWIWNATDVYTSIFSSGTTPKLCTGYLFAWWITRMPQRLSNIEQQFLFFLFREGGELSGQSNQLLLSVRSLFLFRSWAQGPSLLLLSVRLCVCVCFFCSVLLSPFFLSLWLCRGCQRRNPRGTTSVTCTHWSLNFWTGQSFMRVNQLAIRSICYFLLLLFAHPTPWRRRGIEIENCTRCVGWVYTHSSHTISPRKNQLRIHWKDTEYWKLRTSEENKIFFSWLVCIDIVAKSPPPP